MSALAGSAIASRWSLVLLISLSCLTESACAATVVTFGTGPFQRLPYSESGFDFSTLSGSAFLDGPSDRSLTINLPAASTTTGVRIQSSQAFDFLSFDLERTVARNWTIVSSAGGNLSLASGTTAGQVLLPNSSDWQNLTFVDLVHNLGEANAIIEFDNFEFRSPTAVPEPSTAICGFVGACLLLRRRLGKKSRP